MTESAVQKATGESIGSLGWMVVGAVAIAVVVAPLITRFLPVSPTLALILAGVALAYFASGGLRKAGQGAALFGIASYAMSFLAPMLGKLTGAKTMSNGPSGVLI